MILSVTFSHTFETFKGIRDFEKLFLQIICNEENINKLLDRFDTTAKEISYVSSIKIYKHDKANLSKKSELIKEIASSLDFEQEFLKKLKNKTL